MDFAVQRLIPLTEVFCEAIFSLILLEWCQKEDLQKQVELSVFLPSLLFNDKHIAHT